MSEQNTNLKGLVLSAFGGFYQVLVGEAQYSCRLRGKLKRHRAKEDGEGGVYAGDWVMISLHTDGADGAEGMVEEVLERHNFLPRPRVANTGQAVAVLAAREPLYDLLLLDRILVIAAFLGIRPAICFNKADLAGNDLQPLLASYQQAGFQAIAVSAQRGENLDALATLLAGQVSVLAGPSGVGKSSLLNALLPGLEIPVGEVSERLQRGKHTTRHVQLLRLPQGGFVADAPGFSLLDLPQALEPQALPGLYPEFVDAAVNCRFLGCMHRNEPDCAVKEALAAGRVDAGRYERYLRLLTELEEREILY